MDLGIRAGTVAVAFAFFLALSGPGFAGPPMMQADDEILADIRGSVDRPGQGAEREGGLKREARRQALEEGVPPCGGLAEGILAGPRTLSADSFLNGGCAPENKGVTFTPYEPGQEAAFDTCSSGCPGAGN